MRELGAFPRMYLKIKIARLFRVFVQPMQDSVMTVMLVRARYTMLVATGKDVLTVAVRCLDVSVLLIPSSVAVAGNISRL